MEWTPSMSQWNLKYVYLTIWVYFFTPSTTSSLSLSLSLSHTHTHTHVKSMFWKQLEAGTNTCFWRHCLPLSSSSTHDRSSKGRRVIGYQSFVSSQEDTEPEPWIWSKNKTKTCKKKYISLQVGRWRERLWKCSHPLSSVLMLLYIFHCSYPMQLLKPFSNLVH